MQSSVGSMPSTASMRAAITASSRHCLDPDGVPADKARCLDEAAFFERTFNLSDAARKLQTFRVVMRTSLPGASGLFQQQLEQRLKWIDERHTFLHAMRRLADQYLGRNDFVRAAMFAWEALVSAECKGTLGTIGRPVRPLGRVLRKDPGRPTATPTGRMLIAPSGRSGTRSPTVRRRRTNARGTCWPHRKRCAALKGALDRGCCPEAASLPSWTWRGNVG